MAAMMALRAHRRGGPEQLVYEEAPVPEPLADEALVAVHAAGITFAELGWDASWQTAEGADRTPVIPSHEVSGVVAAVGDAVTGLKVGDEVYGLIDFYRNGAAAEYVAVEAAALARRPRTVTHAATAALPLAALTAWQALHDHARLAAGDRVLVHGGAGGVGAFAVQLAALAGAEVTATARGADLDLVRSLGADRVIDYAHEAFDQAVTEVDVVVDTVGGETLARSFPLLRPGGRLVTLPAPAPRDLTEAHDVEAIFFIVRPDQAQLSRLAELVDEGRLRILLAQTCPLAEGRQAYASGGQLHRPGKTVLVVQTSDEQEVGAG